MIYVFFMLTALHKNDIQTSIGSEVDLLNHTFFNSCLPKDIKLYFGKKKHAIVYVNLYFKAFFFIISLTQNVDAWYCGESKTCKLYKNE